MSIEYRTKLATIRRFDQLIEFLRDEMGWPIVSDDFEEMTFEYSAEELGIDAVNAAKIQEIRRLRPLAVNQPWGVFLVRFEPKRLPVVALRSILGRVAQKRRASSVTADQPTWAMDDLLFISNYGVGESRQISFAHFSASPSNKLPTLKVITWDEMDTALHLDQVARELTEGLAWPVDEDNINAWRDKWRTAFTLVHRETITTAQKLSVRLAELASVTRDRINGALAIESDSGHVTRLMHAFAETLVQDLDPDSFADMVAQTIAYGLLSARVTDPQRSSGDVLVRHMRTNPLLRELMTAFLDSSGQQGAMGIDFDELGIAEVIELLDNANMDAVVRDFGDKNPREDPVIHFYESFLTEYDKEKKVARGVFYTPRPVVSYIVRSIDKLLRTKFGLTDGLADVATWKQMTERHTGMVIPEGISPDQAFVQVLDPATGTGTFLVEVIDLIHSTLVGKWKAQGYRRHDIDTLWNEYVTNHLLTRLHGYEILMAPYAIAHVKFGLKLYETGYRFESQERAKIYLTDALEPAQSFSDLMDFAIPALAHEARAVNQIKSESRFTVIFGNPPYRGESANKGGWISDLLRGTRGKQRTENYFEVDGAPLKERNLKWLNDDYVKFLRLAQSEIERSRFGVIGFITNHSYLDNPTYRGMRESLQAAFGSCSFLDLHGNSNKGERTPEGRSDKNVFDIRQGVAISLYVSTPSSRRDRAEVSHADLWGERESGEGGGKYGWLSTNDINSTDWTVLNPESPRYLFIPRDETLAKEYGRGWSIVDVFPINATGIVSKRDHIAYHFDKDNLYRTLNDFSTMPVDEIRQRYRFRESRDGKLEFVKDHVVSYGIKEGYVHQCLYRPFDHRWTYHTDRSRGFLGWPVYDVMRHMTAGPNLGLVTTRQCQRNWSALVSSTIIAHKALATYDINSLFPLYTFPTEGEEQLGLDRQPNLSIEFVSALGSALGLGFVSDGTGDLMSSFGPDDVFNYIYAVFHSPQYRSRYADFLKADFPRVPLVTDRCRFAALSDLGKRLTSVHLLETERSGAPTFPQIGDNLIRRVQYAPPTGTTPGRVEISRDQYFEGIAPEIWEFAIGGYRPAEKWLKDRKGRVLADHEADQYRKIVAALVDTHYLMNEIDNLIDQHGGWPHAFL